MTSRFRRWGLSSLSSGCGSGEVVAACGDALGCAAVASARVSEASAESPVRLCKELLILSTSLSSMMRPMRRRTRKLG